MSTQQEDQSDLINTLLKTRSLSYTLTASDDPFLSHLSSFTYRLLSETDLLFLYEALFVIQSELITNYIKAIAKRIYFQNNSLNIYDQIDYQKGMDLFRSEVLTTWSRQPFDFTSTEYRVSISFHITDTEVSLSIKSNIVLAQTEIDRIQKRLHTPEQTISASAPFIENIDQSEGGGLGIVLILVLLQNTGIGRSNLEFIADQNGSQTTIIIPKNVTKPAIEKHISQNIIGQIEALPAFPERIRQLIELCNSVTISFETIANQIGRDPSLTAQILKLANSAGYISRNKSLTLSESVRIIGLNQVKSFLLVAGARNILSTFVTKDILDEIWKSSNQISYFAGQLSKGNKELKETVILAGLLHDLGRLVIYSSSDENIKELQKLLKQENSEIQALFQEIRLGVSFPEIGAMLAEKWYFPKPIQYAIRHQMKPLLSESKYIGIIYPIYLARCMAEFLNGTQKFEFIESRVLQYFNLQNQAQFTNLAEDFKSQFVQQYIDS